MRDLKPEKAVEIIDTELRGFVVRATPAGTVSYGIRYTNRDGRQCRYSLSRTFPATTVSAAREEARILLGKIASGLDPAEEQRVKRRQALTLRNFLDEQYGKWLLVNTRTGEHIAARIRASFAEHLDRPLHEFNAWIIEKWRSEKMKAGMSASTTNRNITALRGLFSRALEWDLIQAHPLAKVKALREADAIVRWLAEDEEQRLRAALQNREARERAARISANEWRAERRYELLPELDAQQYLDHLRPMVLLSLNTGARQGELTKLRWDAVDLDNAVMTLKGDTTKSGSTRHVPLNAEALDILKRWRKQTDGPIVFPGRTGGELVEVKTAWSNLLKEASIENFRWHDMRHHFASRLVMAGVDLNTVRDLLGHGDLKMTLRYAHLAPEHKAAAVQKLIGAKASFD